MDGAIVTRGYPTNEQFPELNISKHFGFSVYNVEKESSSELEGIDGRKVEVDLPPLVGKRFQDTFERLHFAFWKPPATHDIVISTTTRTQLLTPWPEQRHIHYFHGIHRGSFGFPARDTHSDNSFMKIIQLTNRMVIRALNSTSFDVIDTVVANSTFTANMIEELYDVEVDEIINPSFIDVDEYGTDNEDRDDYYLYLGRLVDAKGVTNIVDAFNEIDIPLRVAGKGPLKEELITKSENNVSILGYISESEKRRLLSNCKGLIHNTIAEPFGVVLVEALASGAPIITANAGNSPNIIEEGKTGVLFSRENGVSFQRPESSTPIVEAIKKAESINWDHEYIRSTAEKYDRSKLLNDWEDLFKEIRESPSKI